MKERWPEMLEYQQKVQAMTDEEFRDRIVANVHQQEESPIERWKERNLRRVDIQGLTVYVLGIEAQAHLETINRNLAVGKLRAVQMRKRIETMLRNIGYHAAADIIASVPLTPEEPT